jgi:hypothetical protein
VVAIATCDSNEIYVALGTLASQRLSVDFATQALEARQVVVQQRAIEVCDIAPQTAALTAFPNRRLVPFEIGHLDITAGAIHVPFLLLSFGSVLPGMNPMIGRSNFEKQPVPTKKVKEL